MSTYIIAEIGSTERERFWSKVDRRDPGECWPWTAALRGPDVRRGYGAFWFRGRHVAASRMAWALTHGDPGDGIVCHTCDNPRCCNPGHLYLGTHLDNARDRASRKRSPRRQPVRWKANCPQGHALDGDNLYVRPNGERQGCKLCMRRRTREWRERQRCQRT